MPVTRQVQFYWRPTKKELTIYYSDLCLFRGHDYDDYEKAIGDKINIAKVNYMLKYAPLLLKQRNFSEEELKHMQIIIHPDSVHYCPAGSCWREKTILIMAHSKEATEFELNFLIELGKIKDKPNLTGLKHYVKASNFKQWSTTYTFDINEYDTDTVEKLVENNIAFIPCKTIVDTHDWAELISIADEEYGQGESEPFDFSLIPEVKEEVKEEEQIEINNKVEFRNNKYVFYGMLALNLILIILLILK